MIGVYIGGDRYEFKLHNGTIIILTKDEMDAISEYNSECNKSNNDEKNITGDICAAG